MPSRNLLLFLALTGAAILTWIYSREPEEPRPRVEAHEQVPGGSYLVGAVLKWLDDTGHIDYRVLADRVEQGSAGDDFEFTGIRVEYDPETDVHWTLSAGHGVAPASRALFDLMGAVRLTLTDEAGQETATLETSEVHYFPDQLRAISDQATVLRRNGSLVRAAGFELNLKTNLLTLMMAYAFTSNPSLAQDDAPETSADFACVQATGDARINECIGMTMNDGVHTLTAGRGYSEDNRIWSLSGGVDVKFARTEIRADSAKWETDEDGALVYAEIRGDPVMMSDFDEAKETPINGTAQAIIYDRRAGTFRLEGQAVLVYGTGSEQKTISGCSVTYNLDNKRYSGGGNEDCVGVQLRLPGLKERDSSEDQPASP